VTGTPMRGNSGPLGRGEQHVGIATRNPAQRQHPDETAFDVASVGTAWRGYTSTATGQLRARELRTLLPILTSAFTNLDTAAANVIVSEALRTRSVEQVCIGLLQPAVNRTGEMWARHEITPPEAQFALNYTRALLFSIFHRTPERSDGPLVLSAAGHVK